MKKNLATISSHSDTQDSQVSIENVETGTQSNIIAIVDNPKVTISNLKSGQALNVTAIDSKISAEMIVATTTLLQTSNSSIAVDTGIIETRLPNVSVHAVNSYVSIQGEMLGTHNQQEPIVFLPFQVDHQFVGRIEQLKKIKEMLEQQPLGIVYQTVSGLGGVGKSYLAMKFAHNALREKKHQLIWWFSFGRIKDDYLKLADILGIHSAQNSETRFNLVIQKINQMKNWLLIFDDVPDYNSIKDYLPNTSSGHILITSRNKFHCESALSLHLGVFTRHESIEYIGQRLKKEDDNFKEKANELAELLGDFPLALAQATAFISRAKLTVPTYISYFHTKRKELWNAEKPPQNYATVISTTWHISFEKIKEESESASELLKHCAYFNSYHIPENILRKIHEENCVNEIFEYILSILDGYCMVERNEENHTLAIHSLVQMVTQDKIKATNQENYYLNKNMMVLRKAFPTTHVFLEHTLFSIKDHFEEYKSLIFHCQLLESHLYTHLFYIKNNSIEGLLSISELATAYFNLGMIYFLLGERKKSIFAFENALEYKSSTYLNGSDQGVLHYYLALANLEDSKINVAHQHFSIALEIFGNRKDLLMISLLCMFGNMLINEFIDIQKGPVLQEQALKIARTIYPSDNLITVQLLHTISNTYHMLGQNQKRDFYEKSGLKMKRRLAYRPVDSIQAIPPQKMILSIKKELNEIKKLHGEYHKFYIAHLCKLGSLNLQQGNLDEAYKVIKTARTLFLKKHSKHNANHISILFLLIQICDELDKIDEAFKYCDLLLEIGRLTFINPHPVFANVLWTVGHIYESLDDLEKAISFYEESLTLHIRCLGEQHPVLVELRYDLAACLYYQENYLAAIDNCELALKIDKISCNKDKFYKMQLLKLLGDCYLKIEYFVKAVSCYEKILFFSNGLVNRFPKIIPLIIEINFSLSDAYYLAGNFEMAKKFAKKSFDTVKDDMTTWQEIAIDSLITLGQIALKETQYADAIAYYNQILAYEELIDDTYISAAYYQIAKVYDRQQQFDNAYKYYLRALEEDCKLKEKDDKAIADVYYRIGNICYQQNKYLEALNAYTKAKELYSKEYENTSTKRIKNLLIKMQECQPKKQKSNQNKTQAFSYTKTSLTLSKQEQLKNESKALLTIIEENSSSYPSTCHSSPFFSSPITKNNDTKNEDSDKEVQEAFGLFDTLQNSLSLSLSQELNNKSEEEEGDFDKDIQEAIELSYTLNKRLSST